MEDDLQWKMTFNGRRPPMENDLKILKVEYLSNHCINTYEKLEKNSKVISSVALLSPAYFTVFYASLNLGHTANVY
jgi:hypothetical protein